MELNNDRAGANFCDAIGKTLKDDLVKDLIDAKYYSLLTDGSTDSGVLEQELIYVLFLNRSGRAEVKFYSIESPDHANPCWIKRRCGTSIHQSWHYRLHKQLVWVER
jgi:hypothetical protein